MENRRISGRNYSLSLYTDQQHTRRRIVPGQVTFPVSGHLRTQEQIAEPVKL